MDVKHATIALVLTLAAWLHGRAWADEAADQYAVAAGHYHAERWNLAAEEFRAFLAAYPQDARRHEARFYLAEALVQSRRFGEAAPLFDQLAGASEVDEAVARKARFRAGETAYFSGNLGGAARHLEEFRRRYGDDRLMAYVLPYLGELALKRGDAETAQQRFAEGMEGFPQGPLEDECRYGQARALEQCGRHEEARRLYMALAAKTASPLADVAQFRLAASRYAAGEYRRAVDAFAAFETTFAHSRWRTHAQLGLGQSLYMLKRYDEAQASLAAVLERRPEEIEARYWLAQTQLAQRDYPAAAASLARLNVPDDHPLAPAIAFYHGDALWRAGQVGEAIARLNRLVQQWPESDWADDALAGRVQAALAALDHEAVERWAEEFNQRAAQSELAPLVARTLARSRLARQDFAGAQRAMARVGQEDDQPIEDPPDANVDNDRYLLALALHGQGQYDAAIDTVRPLLDAEDPVLRDDARRTYGAALLALKRFDEAVRPLELSLESDPPAEVAAQTRAQLVACLTYSGRVADARSHFAELRRYAPPPDVLLPAAEVLAEALLTQGQQPAAAELYHLLAEHQALPAYAAKGRAGEAWILFQQERLVEAAEAFADTARRYPDQPPAVEAALNAAKIYHKLDRVDAALDMFRRVYTDHADSPHQAEALLGAARLHAILKQRAEAEVLYRRLAGHSSQESHDAVLYEWAWILRELGRGDEADAAFQRLRAEHAASRYWADATYRLAEHALARQDLDESRRLLSELIAAQGGAEVLPHALYLSAQVEIAGQQWSAVSTPLRRLVDEYPDSSLRTLAEYWLAEAAYRQNDFETASVRLEDLDSRVAGQQDRWLGMIPLRRAQVLAQQRQWPEALSMAARVAERFPQFEQQYEADYVIGRCLAALGRFDEARQAYRQVLHSPQGSKTETAAMAQWMIGESYFHQKDHEAAVREYLRLEILYAYPTWQAAALLQAGKCHEAMGQWQQATQLYARLLKTYPDTPFSDEAARRLPLAQQRADTSRQRSG